MEAVNPFIVTADGWKESWEAPKLTVLNYSGGRQSTRLLYGVLRGEIEVPEQFVVLNADPGMENSGTYEHNAKVAELCREAGIHFETVDGPNLYEDLLALPESGETRFDTPPYFVKKEGGKRGQLNQRCTQVYKIAPMDRALRRILWERFGLGRKSKRLGFAIVHKWIGFSADEVHRIKPLPQRYVAMRYPLVEMGETKADVDRYFERNGLPRPPRSVCNACFANGKATLKEMHDNRPADWRQAVAVDQAVRDWSCIDVRYPVFVSDTLVPLEDLAARDFDGVGDDDDGSCDSGHCFL